MKYVMSEEEFLLKWNNHQSNFVDVFNELLHDEAFVDVTLVCGGEAVPGHKMVLAACSPLLHRILRDNPCRHPLVILGDVPAGDMRAIMHFIYQGEVSVSQSELASFLKTADNLQIKGLAENRDSGKEDKKRKDKDGDRLEGRPNNKRQRTSEGRLDHCAAGAASAASATSPVSSRSHKSLSDSHSSSHKGRGGGNRATGEEHHHQQGLRSGSGTGGRGSAANTTPNHHHNHHPASRHHNPSSKHSSSKASHGQDIPSKMSSSSAKHRGEEGVSTSHHHHHHHHNSDSSVGDGRLLAKVEMDDLTVKTEPLDYPGEAAWSEAAGVLGREAGLEDAQALLPLAASMPGGLEGVAAAIVASPNLPLIEFGDDSRNDDGSRGDLSTASDDVNVNNTVGTQVQDRHTQGSAGVPGALVRSTLGHPPLQMQKPPHHHPHYNQDDSPPHSKILPGGGAQSFPGLHTLPLPIPSCTLPTTPGGLASPPNPPPSSSAFPFITTITSSGGGNGGHNNNVHKCQQCPFLTSNPYTYTRHLRIHLGTKEFRCRLCGFATSRKDSLIRHFRMKHLTGEMSVYHDLDSRDIEELAMSRVIPEGLQIFAGKL